MSFLGFVFLFLVVCFGFFFVFFVQPFGADLAVKLNVSVANIECQQTQSMYFYLSW